MCTAAFVLFYVLVRLLGDAVGEVCYTVAPTLLGGLRAWRERPAGSTPSAEAEPPGDAAPPGIDSAGPRPESGRRDPGLVVPMTPVTRHRTPCAAA